MLLPVVSVCVDRSVQLDASDITVEVTQSGQTRLQLSNRARGGVGYAVYTQDERGNTTFCLSLGSVSHLKK